MRFEQDYKDGIFLRYVLIFLDFVIGGVIVITFTDLCKNLLFLSIFFSIWRPFLFKIKTFRADKNMAICVSPVV